ncbi:MAG TPA: hypothetical protein VIY27_07115 [Myxococcota bacterium]
MIPGQPETQDRARAPLLGQYTASFPTPHPRITTARDFQREPRAQGSILINQEKED